MDPGPLDITRDWSWMRSYFNRLGAVSAGSESIFGFDADFQHGWEHSKSRNTLRVFPGVLILHASQPGTIPHCEYGLRGLLQNFLENEKKPSTRHNFIQKTGEVQHYYTSSCRAALSNIHGD